MAIRPKFLILYNLIIEILSHENWIIDQLGVRKYEYTCGRSWIHVSRNSTYFLYRLSPDSTRLSSCYYYDEFQEIAGSF